MNLIQFYNPEHNYLFKVATKILEKGMKYVQS